MKLPKKTRYTLIKGQFTIRNPDNPRHGPEPDGDTVTFIPDSISLVRRLRRISGVAPEIRNGHINVRYEGIDALETHFTGMHQDLIYANAARDKNLMLLGFTDVHFFPNSPNVVESVSQNPIPGHVIANGIESNGRLLGMVYRGVIDRVDGDQVFMDDKLFDQSVNAQLVNNGLAYVEPYDSMPISLVTHMRHKLAGVREQGAKGLWPHESVTIQHPATIKSLSDLQRMVMWPKLFRRLVSYFQEGHSGLTQFDSWLRDDPVRRDDTLRLPDGEQGNMHDTYLIDGDTLLLRFLPEDLLITPDPRPMML